MKPYYQDDYATIYHGDCREFLRGQWATYDVVVTDPPYGTGHYATDVEVLGADLLRSWNNVAVFGWPERLVGLCLAAGRVPDEWVTWWPTNGAIRGFNLHGLWREVEAIAAWGDFDWTRLRQQRSSSVRLDIGGDGRLSSHGDPASRRRGDVWRYPSPGLAFESHKRLHPNEKPTELLVDLITAAPQGTVLDPFMGSGSTLRAAKDLGRKCIGIEIEERYCEIAAKRLAQEVLDFGGAA